MITLKVFVYFLAQVRQNRNPFSGLFHENQGKITRKCEFSCKKSRTAENDPNQGGATPLFL
jgi:hypothetical protein